MIKKKLKNLFATVKGAYKEFAAGNTKKNIKSLLVGKKPKKGKKKRVDIYTQGQKRKKAMEAAGKY